MYASLNCVVSQQREKGVQLREKAAKEACILSVDPPSDWNSFLLENPRNSASSICLSYPDLSVALRVEMESLHRLL